MAELELCIAGPGFSREPGCGNLCGKAPAAQLIPHPRLEVEGFPYVSEGPGRLEVGRNPNAFPVIPLLPVLTPDRCAITAQALLFA